MKSWMLAGLLLCCSPVLPVHADTAADKLDIEQWSRAPVLDRGRIKPLDSFARETLLSISGKSTLQRAPAAEWLSRVFFDPESTRDDEIFLVNNPEVAEALNIEADGRARYSYRQLEHALAELNRQARAAFGRDESKRSLVDQEFIQLFHNLTTYQRLTQSLDFLLPRDEFSIGSPELRSDLGLSESGPVSYLDLKLRQSEIQALIAANSGTAVQDRTDYQKDLFRVSMLSRMWSQQRKSLPPTMLPAPMAGSDQWLGFWDVLSMPAGIGLYRTELAALADMGAAYRSGDQTGFDAAALTYLDSLRERINDAEAWGDLNLEVVFNNSNAFYRSELLFGLAFILSLFSVAFTGKWIYRIAFLTALIALFPQTYGIICRMLVMDRPPVTNLYSTFVFVSWCCALIGLTVEYFQRNRLGLITAGSMGLALLLTARRFGTDGDTMGVMVAVLDSNFWLATHVVTISIGYAGCVASGLLGHIYLLQALRRKPDDPRLRETFRAVYGAQAFGLIFAFLGTMLGGVWADQSWGRFWGWDPKENGALVIVLWSAVLFHARLARMMGQRGFAAGSVIGVIWVLLAWLGVNLLNVGLHSYGFTSGIARGLAIACGFEILFVLATAPFAKRGSVKNDEQEPPL